MRPNDLPLTPSRGSLSTQGNGVGSALRGRALPGRESSPRSRRPQPERGFLTRRPGPRRQHAAAAGWPPGWARGGESCTDQRVELCRDQFRVGVDDIGEGRRDRVRIGWPGPERHRFSPPRPKSADPGRLVTSVAGHHLMCGSRHRFDIARRVDKCKRVAMATDCPAGDHRPPACPITCRQRNPSLGEDAGLSVVAVPPRGSGRTFADQAHGLGDRGLVGHGP